MPGRLPIHSEKLDEAGIKKNPAHIRIRQLAFVSPDERTAAFGWADRMLAGENAPDNLKELVLRTADGAVDVAMFGRMLADDPEFNREAAVQVSHAITTHEAVGEDDWYAAVDDLKRPSEDTGAGFLGEAGFGSGVYYVYACIDTDLLVNNLAGDRALARRALAAAVEAFATASPSGPSATASATTPVRVTSAPKVAGSSRAAWHPPFSNPSRGKILIPASVSALEDMAEKFDRAYGPQADEHATMNVVAGVGDLAAIQSFVARQIADA